MFEPTYNDTGVSYEEKGDVREYLGDKETERDVLKSDDVESVDDADGDQDEDVDEDGDKDDDGDQDEDQDEDSDDDQDKDEDDDVDDDPDEDGDDDPDEKMDDGSSEDIDDAIDFLGNKGPAENESDYDSSDEENYQKLETDINSTELLQKHPCAIEHSYQEIQAFTKIVRNEKGEIIDELHKTLPFLTKYEYARIIGVRTKELNEGADPFVGVDNNIIDGYNIAIKELEEKKLPFIVKRPLPNGSCEYWKLADLELIHF